MLDSSLGLQRASEPPQLQRRIDSPIPYESNGVPAFNYDRAQTVASVERMKKIAANLNATVIIQHDLRDIGKLPAFPAAAK